MDYRILGPLEATSNGSAPDLGPPKQRALLGVLVLHAGETVSVAHLVDALWGTDPPRTAAHSIQTYVSGLRAALGPETVVTSPPGYRLATDPDAVDARRFERLVASGEEALAAGRAEEAAAFFSEALDLWRGEPLADIAGELFDAPQVRRLEELRLTAAERWADAQLAAGNPEQVVAEMNRLTAAHPLRESLWHRRMLALYRSGRAAEALRVFQELKELLGAELGVEPSRDVVQLEEQILLQDPHLGHPSTDGAPPSTRTGARNPYKGLRPFGVDDAEDFHGRSALVRELLAAIEEPGLVAVVGPSGSGKSSVVRAGLIPAVLAVPDRWTVAVVFPGERPRDEVDRALAEAEAARAGRRMLLVIDQFEEVFTLAPEGQRSAFLDHLSDLAEDPDAGVEVVVALRADFYDRPLLHPRFGKLVAAGTVQVTPMDVEELQAAAVRPAASVGVTLEPALLAALAADLADRPGALPQFQYALTELFERRSGDVLTLDSYRAIGGIEGALTRRAEEIFSTFDEPERLAAAQLALRLVTPAGPGGDARRRVPAAEIAALEVDPVAMHAVMERLGRHRLLSFDRDPADGRPTVELAHEALITGWDRLHRWVDQARDDLQTHDALVVAIGEWERSGHDPGYLPTDTRLAEYERWAERGSMRLTSGERAFLDAGIARRDEEQAREAQRSAEREALKRRSRHRLWAGVAATLVALAAVAALWVATQPAGPRVALVYEGTDTQFSKLMENGFRRAADTFDIQAREVVTLIDAAEDIGGLCRAGYDLIVVGGFTNEIGALDVIGECGAETTLIVLDSSAGVATSCIEAVSAVGYADVADHACELMGLQDFASNEGSFLVGAAAAMSTETGRVGFVGGQPTEMIEPFRAGFEAGVHFVDPEVEVLSTFVHYQSDPVSMMAAFANPSGGRQAAERLYRSGVDIVYHAAGASGEGVINAAVDLSEELGRKLWVVGVDADEYLTHASPERDHILTSMWKRLDEVVFVSIERYLDGDLPVGEIWVTGLAEGMVDYSREGGFLEVHVDELESLRERIVSGDVEVPVTPTLEPLPAPGATVQAHVAFDGESCVWTGPDEARSGDRVAVRVTNNTDDRLWLVAGNTVREMPDVASGDAATDGVIEETAAVIEAAPGTIETMYVYPIEGSFVIGCRTVDGTIYKATQFDVLAPR